MNKYNNKPSIFILISRVFFCNRLKKLEREFTPVYSRYYSRAGFTYNIIS